MMGTTETYLITTLLPHSHPAFKALFDISKVKDPFSNSFSYVFQQNSYVSS
jgi:hypothetical protein